MAQLTGQVRGKAAIVTGGASGIGEACAETLAREGAAVLVTDVDDALGKGVVERITLAGSATPFADVKTLVAKVAATGIRPEALRGYLDAAGIACLIDRNTPSRLIAC